MPVFEVTTAIVPVQIINVPEQISLPELRYAAPSGTLSQGCTIELTCVVKDKDGNVVPLAFDKAKVTINDWPADIQRTNDEGTVTVIPQEILGVLYMNFVVSAKA